MSAHDVTALPDMRIPAGHSFGKLGPILLVVGLAGLGASFALSGEDHDRFHLAYLTAWLFGLSIGLGALFFVIVQHASRAAWSVVVRRTAENLAVAVPVMALLFVPLWLGRHEIWHHWMDAATVEADEILKGKSAYLSEGAWAMRTVFYFVVWTLLAAFYRRTSVRQDDADRAGAIAATRRMSFFSGPAIAAFALTLTFAAIDWIMTLDPHWYSTMWGVYFFAGCYVAGVSTMALIHLRMSAAGLTHDAVTVEHFHDLGKLVFAFTVFWTYIAFGQYFLIWYANIPEEVSFYMKRQDNDWQMLGYTLMVGHFAVPFLFLMSRHIKRNRVLLALGCVWMLCMQAADLTYLVTPNHGPDAHLGAPEAAALFGMFAIVVGVALTVARGAALMPVRDPRLPESLAFENP
jgi:hypothetical protein